MYVVTRYFNNVDIVAYYSIIPACVIAFAVACTITSIICFPLLLKRLKFIDFDFFKTLCVGFICMIPIYFLIDPIIYIYINNSIYDDIPLLITSGSSSVNVIIILMCLIYLNRSFRLYQNKSKLFILLMVFSISFVITFLLFSGVSEILNFMNVSNHVYFHDYYYFDSIASLMLSSFYYSLHMGIFSVIVFAILFLFQKKYESFKKE